MGMELLDFGAPRAKESFDKCVIKEAHKFREGTIRRGCGELRGVVGCEP
jgi:hypothetical protein